jgi:hypothetical protein
MYKHRVTTPDWLYCEPNLNPTLLPAIRAELLKLFVITKQHNLVPYTSTFADFDHVPTIVQTCPVLIEELKNLDLHEKTLEGMAVSFISVVADREFPAHVDVKADIGLNIPLLNCDGTYTVWYDGQVMSGPGPDYTLGSEEAKNAKPGDPNSLIEIDRCHANRPLWINVNVLHRPVTTHNKFRVAASLRFFPAPMDANNMLWPHLIAPK